MSEDTEARDAFRADMERVMRDHWQTVAPAGVDFEVPGVAHWALVVNLVDAAVPDNDNDWVAVLRSAGGRSIHVGLLYQALTWLSADDA